MWLPLLCVCGPDCDDGGMWTSSRDHGGCARASMQPLAHPPTTCCGDWDAGRALPQVMRMSALVYRCNGSSCNNGKQVHVMQIALRHLIVQEGAEIPGICRCCQMWLCGSCVCYRQVRLCVRPFVCACQGQQCWYVHSRWWHVRPSGLVENYSTRPLMGRHLSCEPHNVGS